MPSKQQLAREAIANLALRAAIQSTNYEVTGEYGLSPEGIERQKRQREFDAMRAEEAASQKQEQLNSPYIKTLRAQWRKPLATIMHDKTYSMGLFLDPLADLPMTSNPTESDFSKAEQIITQDLDDVLESRGVVLSNQGKLRTLCYGGLQSDAVTVTNGILYRGAVGTLQYWIACVNRLAELDIYDESEYAALPEAERQTEPVEESASADDLKAVAEEEWSKFPLWHAWEDSLLAGFGIKLNDRVRRIVCDEFVRANLSPYVAESFNEIRRRLVAREIFPTRPNGEPALTLDERMAAATENYDLSNPVQKKAWCHEIGRLKAILGE